MSIAAGELDQRITVLAPMASPAPMGGEDQTLRLLRVIWAKAMEGMGKEFVAAGAVMPGKKVAFKTRWAQDIAALEATAQLVWSGWLFEVVATTGTRRSGEYWLHGQALRKYA